MVLIQIEPSLVRAEGRITLGAARRADAAIEIVRHRDTCARQSEEKFQASTVYVLSVLLQRLMPAAFLVAPKPAETPLAERSLKLCFTRRNPRKMVGTDRLSQIVWAVFGLEVVARPPQEQKDSCNSAPGVEQRKTSSTAPARAQARGPRTKLKQAPSCCAGFSKGCRPFNIAGAAPGYARNSPIAIDNLYDKTGKAVNIKNAKAGYFLLLSLDRLDHLI